MELLGTPAVQRSFALFLTPPVKLLLDSLSTICLWLNQECSQNFPYSYPVSIFSVAICADVEKMFREIKVHEEDVDWQKNSLEGFSNRTYKGIWPNNCYVCLASDVDNFTFTITVNETDVWTKRKVLSEVAKIFDPLGWLAPSVVFSKIFLQELWSHHLSWDEELPDSLAIQWRIFQEQLPLLTNIKIPRCILLLQAIDVQVHGFCDSSEKAYCAVIYIRSKDATQTIVSRLLTSKTRVSPVKTQSLPRLELCSALLLANLLQATLPTLILPISETFAWSDSKITLAWLKSDLRDGNRS
ncbi:uncharacterized protein TNCV_2542381 [Trichonephila clavipes]|nr:uncharacterized protein TNCV_2542381 [Trichonephila clavipes]